LSASQSDERAASGVSEEPVASPLQFTTLDEIMSALCRLESRFEARFAYDATKEDAFRHVYADLQDAKVAHSLEATRPLLLDLLLLFDRIDAASNTLDMTEAASVLGSFREELLEILYRRDVRSIVAGSDRYDRDTQQVVGVVDTPEAEEHQKVERIVRTGFRWGTRILRAEDVVIRRYRPAITPSESISGGAD
jgi:molecular chaperone GrpE (heat shock protein)